MTLYDSAAIQAFFDGWDLYRRVIENDYMFHRIIHERIRGVVAAYPGGRILDLGSGDSSVMARTLGGLPIREYTGVDLSLVALQQAEVNLAQATYQRNLHLEDLLEHLGSAPADAFDVVVAGYTVHHFSSHEVARFFSDVRRVLVPGGTLLVYDVIRGEEETRDDNLTRNHAWRTRHWRALSDDDLAALWGHVSVADFPKTRSELSAHARQAGFEQEPEALFEAETGIHKLYTFR